MREDFGEFFLFAEKYLSHGLVGLLFGFGAEALLLVLASRPIFRLAVILCGFVFFMIFLL